jgi:hypothetical protein
LHRPPLSERGRQSNRSLRIRRDIAPKCWRGSPPRGQSSPRARVTGSLRSRSIGWRF